MMYALDSVPLAAHSCLASRGKENIARALSQRFEEKSGRWNCCIALALRNINMLNLNCFYFYVSYIYNLHTFLNAFIKIYLSKQ